MTKVFIAGQVLDGVTTFIGLNFFDGVFAEGNPIFKTPFSMVMAKIVATVFVALMLERFGEHKLFWIIPVMTWFPVVWNTSMMLAWTILF